MSKQAIPCDESALVLFSGGQDSTLCLAWALERFASVETVGFDYGQRHAVELVCRDAVRAGLRRIFPERAARLGDDHRITIGGLGDISETALTRETEITLGEDGLPTSFVPGRNLIFLNFAAALAYRRGIRHLVGGMCETDYSGYPDCRDATIQAMGRALDLGMDRRFVIHTPLMWIDKAGTWKMAEDLGGQPLVEMILEETHSCYLGDRRHRHAWGYGCGTCPACDLRAAGYERYRADQARAAPSKNSEHP